jgi:hypothetical protein
MSQDYGSATIAAAVTVGPPGGPAVQPPIGWNALTAANTDQWNGHIGNSLRKPVPLTPDMVAGYGGYVATPGTVGRDELGALMTWATCVAGCAQGATGTLTGSTFVVGAGTAVAKSAIPANGYGWVKN